MQVNRVPTNAVLKLLSVMLACLLSMTAYAAIDVYDFDSPQQEAQYRGLIEELRCPKCQNQNLAASDAPIAQDLKQKTFDLIKDGRSDGEIRDYMQERYGDFISYKPPVRPSTWILWFFPPLLLIVLIIGWFWQSKRRQVVARGQKDVIVDSTAEPLTPAEQAELDRLLSRAENVDHDITSPEDKK
ncbi:cytochrome c-type biogenesis protein CcmH [Psychrobacter frigidicola]|uniref:Cytochrome c-type biogenesis protein n=2 Tax=Psychrobacter frigidicola TaxID=45611 RepID=A0A5C7A512_9GAMM|nr:cytochrome c-type biogenesis protein [Psychrobacter frigidicola]TXD98569.1 cytochrome c-type biogenesis protein CcmH [Psychrobacter frigidicola]